MISQDFSGQICPQMAYAIFFDALTEPGIEPLIQAASELFGCPVLLTDENYKLLCQFPKRKIGQPVWDTLYEKGTLPAETVWAYQDAFLHDTPKIYEPFYADWGLAKDFPRIFGEVYTKNLQILGHFAIFMLNRGLEPYDLEAARIFTKALQIKMSEKIPQNMSDSRYLHDILSPEATPQIKEYAASKLSWHIHGNYCFMVTPLGESAAQKAYASIAINRLRATLRNTVSTIFNDNIVTLFGGMSQLRFTQQERVFLKQTAGFLEQNYLACGISECFSDISQTRCYYEQALYTVMLHSSETTFYSDVAPAPMFMLLLDKSPLRTFLHPVLSKILSYDEQNGTQYFQTLQCYSLSIHDKEYTASKLCIHRNTLLYRLNKIQSLFNLSFEEPKTALHLLNSFQLWSVYVEKIGKSDKLPSP